MPRTISGQRMRAARERAGFSRELAAIQTGKSYNAISAYERGLTAPRARVLVALADLYGCTIDEFFENEAVAQ